MDQSLHNNHRRNQSCRNHHYSDTHQGYTFLQGNVDLFLRIYQNKILLNRWAVRHIWRCAV